MESLRRILQRERQARKNAEKIIEEKSREIYYANQALLDLNRDLESIVQERTADLEKAISIRDSFLKSLGHELKTPLHIISGNLTLLEDKFPNNEHYKQIDEELKKLNSIINNLILLAEIKSGKIIPIVESFKLKNLIQNIFTTHSKIIQKKELIVSLPEIEIIIKSDLKLFTQVISKLLSFLILNSINNSEIKIELKTEEYLNIFLTGTGDFEFLKNIKLSENPLDSWDGSNINSFSSTALGLGIIKRLCSLIGGNLQISANKENLSFDLYLKTEFEIQNTQSESSLEYGYNEEINLELDTNLRNSIIKEIDKHIDVRVLDEIEGFILQIKPKLVISGLVNIVDDLESNINEFDFEQLTTNLKILKGLLENE